MPRNNPNTRFPKNFREFIVALNCYQVEYMIIGGYAVGAYGYARGTNDLDIFINATDENAQKMRQAWVSYGIAEEQLELDMFLVPKMIVIGEPPLRIEVLKKLNTKASLAKKKRKG